MVFSVTMVRFRITLLMRSEQILSWMMNESIHWPKPYLLLSATCDEIFSSIIPSKKFQKMTNNVGLTFSVCDTKLQFRISIEQDN